MIQKTLSEEGLMEVETPPQSKKLSTGHLEELRALKDDYYLQLMKQKHRSKYQAYQKMSRNSHKGKKPGRDNSGAQ